MLQQAKRAVDDAQRGLETAKRNADEAAAGTITAAAQLNYLLAQLSPAERRLYDALTNIREAYKDTYRPITDLIIDSFTRSVEGVQRIMLMPDVISMARKTAEQIAESVEQHLRRLHHRPDDRAVPADRRGRPQEPQAAGRYCHQSWRVLHGYC